MKPGSSASVPGEEQLARFLLYSRWLRADGTVRPEAFSPPPDLNLSVTRHASLAETELWSRGLRVAEQVRRTLYGRADVVCGRVAAIGLRVEPAEQEENPQHAHITGWPDDKPAQKSLAQRIAAEARFSAYGRAAN